MGVAKVECRSGCTCDPTRLDGTWKRQVSLQQIHMFKVGGVGALSTCPAGRTRACGGSAFGRWSPPALLLIPRHRACPALPPCRSPSTPSA